MSGDRFSKLRRALSRSTSTRSTTTTPSTSPPPSRLQRTMTSMRGLWSFSSRSQRRISQPLPPPPPPLVYGPAPRTSKAFSELQRDPAQFMRRNALKVRGQYLVSSGPKDFVMYNAGPVGKRRNSVSKEMQDVFEYRISSRKDFEEFANNRGRSMSSFDVHPFRAQHIAMEPAYKAHGDVPDQTPGTTASVISGHKQNYITNRVTGCSIVEMDGELSHQWPYAKIENNYSSGEELEGAIKRAHPEAQVYGPSSYDKSGTDLFIQSGRRGSVHIFGQSRETGRDTDQWSANVTHTHFAPVRSRPRRVRYTDEFFRKNVEAARKGAEFEEQLNKRIEHARKFIVSRYAGTVRSSRR